MESPGKRQVTEIAESKIRNSNEKLISSITMRTHAVSDRRK
jgi:hypothetical protein